MTDRRGEDEKADWGMCRMEYERVRQELADVPGRAREILIRNGYRTRAEIATASNEQLLEIRMMGPAKLADVRSVIPFSGKPELTDTEGIAQLEVALAERDALLAKMLDGLRRLEWAGRDTGTGNCCCPVCHGPHADAWHTADCWLATLLQTDRAIVAADQWRRMREVLAELADVRPARDYGTVPVPARLVFRARVALGRGLGQSANEGGRAVTGKTQPPQRRSDGRVLDSEGPPASSLR